MDNIALLTDSYKVSHWKQYPPGTTNVYSYLESRGGKFDKTVFFGLQYILLKHLIKPITVDEIDYARAVWKQHFGADLFNYDGWLHICETHGGNLPVVIHAVPEGTVVNNKNVLMTIQNTDPKVPWLTNWLETLLMQIWYPTTIATQSYYMRKNILDFLNNSGTPESIDYKLHDFGFRGSTSLESAGIGGAAHLLSFKGTDTSPGFLLPLMYYSNTSPPLMCGNSIPAAEHSTITSWGKENEAKAYKNMLVQYPEGMVAVVSDSYDIFNACDNIWGDLLKDKVLARNGVLIIRPDSGNPVDVLSKCLDILYKKFGGYVNSKGFKVLNDKVRLIQGDGISFESINVIMNELTNLGWSIDNLAFGSGGGLLQQVNRDTCQFAIKCSAIKINETWNDVYKSPVTSQNKVSKKGRLALIQENNEYKTVVSDGTYTGSLVKVFENGVTTKLYSFNEIRNNLIVTG